MSSVRQISLGGVKIGGGAPVVVQSMTCTRTGDADATLAQVRALVSAGCEVVRVSLPSRDDVQAFAQIVREAPVPVIADIHYEWRLALAAIDCGAAGVRVNPGTLGERHLAEVVRAAGDRRLVYGGDGREIEGPVALRIGVNAGSLPRALRATTPGGRPPSTALVDAALAWSRKLEDWGCLDFKVSVKSSSVRDTIAAYRDLAARIDAPLHVGVTEAGTLWSGTIKSAVGIGTLLAEGIGDTVRVSLTGDPVEEVRVAWKILAALGLRSRGPDVISCPTCGRTEIDVVALANEVERRLAADPRFVERALTVAVMGCRVNGPEEARHADFGIAAGAGEGQIFVRGRRVATVPESDLVEALFGRIRRACEDEHAG